jgi:hypothetical protein
MMHDFGQKQLLVLCAFARLVSLSSRDKAKTARSYATTAQLKKIGQNRYFDRNGLAFPANLLEICPVRWRRHWFSRNFRERLAHSMHSTRRAGLILLY